MLPPLIEFSYDDIEAVVYDIGGIFAIPSAERLRAQLVRHELPAPTDDELYRQGHWAGVRAIADSFTQGYSEDNTDVWAAYNQAYVAKLAMDVDAAAVLAEGLDRLWVWVQDEAVAAAHRLHTHGMPAAVVSNNNGTAPEQMVDFGVGQLGKGPGVEFAAIIDSTTVGIAKPDPRIFEPALEALGLPRERVLYIGDTVLADVHGASAAGMPVVQIDPYDDHAHYDHVRAPSVAAVIDELIAR